MRLTADLLADATGCTPERAQRYGPHLADACAAYGIDTPQRLAHFLAQIGHESGSLRYVEELASGEAYEGRRDLGNTEPGDGRRYKGRGLIQTTGRANYAAVTQRLAARGAPDFVAQPERLTEPQWACWSAADYWGWRGLNALADRDDITLITRRINGGLNGQADRERRWELARAALGASADRPAPVTTIPVPRAPLEPADALAPQENAMPLSAVLTAVLPTLIGKIPELVQLSNAKGDERKEKALALAADVAAKAVGAANVQDLAETIERDPTAATIAREAVQKHWFEIQQTAGDVAATRAWLKDAGEGAHGERVWSIVQMVTLAAVAFLGLANVIAAVLMGIAIWRDTLTEASMGLLIQVIQADIGAALMAFGFWLGSSWGSKRADEKPRPGTA